MWKALEPILLLLSCSFIMGATAYRPVIIMHGLTQLPEDMEKLKEMITNAHPGTPVHVVDAFNGVDSLRPMREQSEGVYKIIAPILDKSPEGVIFIGYSQGGLILRGILEAHPTHDITFIALASPINGQWGVPSVVKDVLPFITKEDGFMYCHLLGWNEKISICNWWKDPLHTMLYKCKSRYLYPLEAPALPEYKTNFEKLAKLVLIGGPDDGVVTPWQSTQFGFSDKDGNIVDYKNQQFYIDNTFGLKTLDEEKRIHFHVVPGVDHSSFPDSEKVFECCIKPYLN